MRSLWWTLPGPENFLEHIAEDLWDGKSIYLRVPHNEPWGLKAYLKEELPDRESVEWRDLNLSYLAEDAGHPVNLLYDVFLPEARPDVIRNTIGLVKEMDFHGKIIWIDGMAPDYWTAWEPFLHEYADLCRNIPAYERTRFIVLLSGEMAAREPRTSIAATVRDWRDMVGKLDMQLYCSSLLKRRRLSSFQKTLAVHLIAQLAQWDQRLADWLCDCELGELFEPIPLLRKFAAELGWDADSPASWPIGTLNDYEGKTQRHSAYLAALGEEDHLERRVWEAQLSVLFPYIEEQRLHLVEALGPALEVPFTNERGYVIYDKLDLEIGHIEYQMRSMPTVDERLKRSVNDLRRLRNILAHMNPVRTKDIGLVETLETLGDMIDCMMLAEEQVPRIS